MTENVHHIAKLRREVDSLKLQVDQLRLNADSLDSKNKMLNQAVLIYDRTLREIGRMVGPEGPVNPLPDTLNLISLTCGTIALLAEKYKCRQCGQWPAHDFSCPLWRENE